MTSFNFNLLFFVLFSYIIIRRSPAPGNGAPSNHSMMAIQGVPYEISQQQVMHRGPSPIPASTSPSISLMSGSSRVTAVKPSFATPLTKKMKPVPECFTPPLLNSSGAGVGQAPPPPNYENAIIQHKKLNSPITVPQNISPAITPQQISSPANPRLPSLPPYPSSQVKQIKQNNVTPVHDKTTTTTTLHTSPKPERRNHTSKVRKSSITNCAP